MKESLFYQLHTGKNLSYAEYGDEQGEPLFFFHGWPSSRFQAQVIDNAAKERNVRVLSPDRPGFGNSDFDPKRELLDWPDVVVELADSLKISTFSVVGVSGGGPYAAACAYKIPDRLEKAGIVVGLAPTNIVGALEGKALANRLTWMGYHYFPFLRHLSAYISLVQTQSLLAQLFTFSYGAKVDQAMLDSALKADIRRNRSEAFRQGKEGAAKDLELFTKDWGFDLSKISTEVLLWYGDEDQNVSLNMGKYYEQKIPNSRLTVYPKEGHFLLKNHAEEIVTALQAGS